MSSHLTAVIRHDEDDVDKGVSFTPDIRCFTLDLVQCVQTERHNSRGHVEANEMIKITFQTASIEYF